MVKAAVVQLCSSDCLSDNLAQVDTLLRQGAAEGVSLVVLPENFAFMGKHEQDKLKIAENFGKGPIQDFLAAKSAEYQLWIVAGTIPIHAGDNKVFAACLVYNNRGECQIRYDKIHLFDVRVSEEEAHQESASIKAGSRIELISTPVGMLGLSVCYDLRFPELFRQLTLSGACLFSVPSAFTEVTGKAHWQVLLRARAIENLSYVLAANQSGVHANGRKTFGHSMIIDPWGNILAEMGKGTGLICQEIDLEWQQTLRQQFPSNEHHVLEKIQ